MALQWPDVILFTHSICLMMDSLAICRGFLCWDKVADGLRDDANQLLHGSPASSAAGYNVWTTGLELVAEKPGMLCISELSVRCLKYIH